MSRTKMACNIRITWIEIALIHITWIEIALVHITWIKIALDNYLVLLLVTSTNDQVVLGTYKPEELLKPLENEKRYKL